MSVYDRPNAGKPGYCAHGELDWAHCAYCEEEKKKPKQWRDVTQKDINELNEILKDTAPRAAENVIHKFCQERYITNRNLGVECLGYRVHLLK